VTAVVASGTGVAGRHPPAISRRIVSLGFTSYLSSRPVGLVVPAVSHMAV
jgi:hypothetical protein